MTPPPAYPPASRPTSQIPNDHGTSRPIVTPKERRLSQARLTSIARQLSTRDQDVLATVGRFRVMSGDHLRRLFWPDGRPQTSARLARHGLTRLEGLGVLESLPRRVGGIRAGSAGRIFALGPAGQRLHRSGRSRRYAPGERHLAHTLAISDLYVRLIEAQRWEQLEVLVFEPEPECWRPYPGPWGAKLTLKPDAFVKLGVGDYAYSWFLEIDMATESLATIERKTRRHSDYHDSGTELGTHGVAPRIAWLTSGQARAERIESVLVRLSPDERKRFAVSTQDDALTLLPTGVWT